MAEIKFEEALTRLEKIVRELEEGNLSLDDSLKRYEEGIKLSRLCTRKLEEAQKKVEILIKSDDGRLVVKPFEEFQTEDDSENDQSPRSPGKDNKGD
jgi:exodeoxyribonuclease VII small subunit